MLSGDDEYDDDSTLKLLLHDRVEFKLYAAEQHLIRLKEIGNDIVKDNARIEVEMEIDCFLSHLVGAVDSLLFEINDKLELGVRPYDVSFANVQSALNAKTKKIDLLGELDDARQNGRWYAILDELRNQSVHATFLKKVKTADAFSGEHSELRFMRFRRDSDGEDNGDVLEQTAIMNIEVIPYLEKSLQQVRDMIYRIKSREPLLSAR
ncbi:MAG TPA: hypothetical protein VHA09_06195 [Nitrososphaera sp.]|nr:hypothetical protein [Nitrososphaera sp.]